MTTPDPAAELDVLQRIAAAVENLAFQQETANLLAYEASLKTVALQQIAKRLGVEPPEVPQ